MAKIKTIKCNVGRMGHSKRKPQYDHQTKYLQECVWDGLGSKHYLLTYCQMSTFGEYREH